VSYRLVFEDQVAEDLAGLPRAVRRRLVSKLAALAEDPRPPAAEPLTGNLRGYWRLRVGDYRASYSIDQKNQAVHVWNAGHRSRFYDRARRKRR
jgi:mRNA interferase RelE/StbE